MAIKRKYPEPYKRPNNTIYYFMFVEKDGKRHRMASGLTAKEVARDFIRTFIEEQSVEAITLCFANYVVLFCKAETCPHFIRYRQEGKNIGLNHLHQCRTLLGKHAFKDSVFLKLALDWFEA